VVKKKKNWFTKWPRGSTLKAPRDRETYVYNARKLTGNVHVGLTAERLAAWFVVYQLDLVKKK
jgi:hypothetical protein